MPVAFTPSMAVTSGLSAPLPVGPWLLKDSMVSLSGSAAQIAPVESTPPPASDWAGTLPAMVL